MEKKKFIFFLGDEPLPTPTVLTGWMKYCALLSEPPKTQVVSLIVSARAVRGIV